MLELKISKTTIESNHNGYCSIEIREESNEKWLEFHGNEDDASYPLILQSNEDIDKLSAILKGLLNQ